MMADIVGIPKQDASDLRKALDNMKRTMADQLEVIELAAKLDRAKFDAYLKYGFTKEQAIDLLKAEKIKARI